MKKKIIESLEIPEGITCEVSSGVIKCTKGSVELSRDIHLSGVLISIKGNTITFTCERGNKTDFKRMKSNIVHLKNIFKGLNEGYTYKLEACNVHFPMTLKIQGDKFLISNFLGEKNPRSAFIIPGAKVEIKGMQIIVSSHSKESAGQTAANIEKATKIRNRDRRVFQDGIYITEKAGREI